MQMRLGLALLAAVAASAPLAAVATAVDGSTYINPVLTGGCPHVSIAGTAGLSTHEPKNVLIQPRAVCCGCGCDPAASCDLHHVAMNVKFHIHTYRVVSVMVAR